MRKTVFPHLGGNFEGYRLGGVRSYPVVTGKIGYLLFARSLVFVEVGFFEQVGYFVARYRRLRVRFRIDFRFIPLIRKRSVARSTHFAFVYRYARCFLYHKYIVYGVMRVGADGEIIVALTEYVGLCFDMVVRS